MKALPLGPVMADVAGLELTAEEAEFLRHPAIGAVILFARNYASPAQLKALTAAIRAVRKPELLTPAAIILQSVRGDQSDTAVLAVACGLLFLLVIYRMSGLIRQVETGATELRERTSALQAAHDNAPVPHMFQHIRAEDHIGLR